MPPADVHECMCARARRAVGEHAPGDYILRPREHANALPPEAGPLKRILEQPGIEAIKADYDRWNADALHLQGRHMRWGKRGIVAAMAAAVAAVIVTVSPIDMTPLQSVLASSFVWLLLCVSWIYFALMMWRRPLEGWYKARANAEEYRKRLFEAVLEATETAGPGEIAVLPLQLEYFRRYQFEMQREYFAGKSRMAARRARWTDAVGWLWATIPFAALGLTLAAGLAATSEQGFMHPLVTKLGGAVQAVERLSIDTYGIGAAIIVAAASAGLFAIAQLDNYRRNAVRYTNMLSRLEELQKDPRLGFNPARFAADAGIREPVVRLVREMHALMTSELAEWVTVGLNDKGAIDMPERQEIPAAYRLEQGPDRVLHLFAGSKLTPGDFGRIRAQVDAPLLTARKIGFVAARQTGAEENVVTHWNGKESADVARPGDWVVTNMSAAGEILRDRDQQVNTYVIRAETFPRLYDLHQGENAFGQVYKSRSVVEAFLLPGSFEILAPWDEMQRGARGYLLNNGKEVYGNNRETFEATYEIVDGTA